MPTLDVAFPLVSRALVDQYGRAPSDFEGLGPFETMVAVLLARSMRPETWKAGIVGLREAGLLTPDRLADAAPIDIADALRSTKPAPSIKTIAPLKHLARWFAEAGDMGESSVSQLREDLAALNGISMAGADALLLFALERPSYPVDRASFRILVRHGWLDRTAAYEEARDALTGAAASAVDGRDLDETRVLIDLATGLAQVGRTYCRAAAPKCEGCPLESFLPEGGARDDHD
jgi:endonuclease III related protein